MGKFIIDVCDCAAVFAAIGIIPVGGETLADPGLLIAIIASVAGLRLFLLARNMLKQ